MSEAAICFPDTLDTYLSAPYQQGVPASVRLETIQGHAASLRRQETRLGQGGTDVETALAIRYSTAAASQTSLERLVRGHPHDIEIANTVLAGLRDAARLTIRYIDTPPRDRVTLGAGSELCVYSLFWFGIAEGTLDPTSYATLATRAQDRDSRTGFKDAIDIVLSHRRLAGDKVQKARIQVKSSRRNLADVGGYDLGGITVITPKDIAPNLSCPTQGLLELFLDNDRELPLFAARAVGIAIGRVPPIAYELPDWMRVPRDKHPPRPKKRRPR